MKFKGLNIHGIIPRQGFLRRRSNGAASLPMVTLKLSDFFFKNSLQRYHVCLVVSYNRATGKAHRLLGVKNNKRNVFVIIWDDLIMGRKQSGNICKSMII